MARWHSLKVSACELRVEASLFTGQMFGWKRHDGHFIGVLGREVLGLKECADDVEGCSYTNPRTAQPKIKGKLAVVISRVRPI